MHDARYMGQCKFVIVVREKVVIGPNWLRPISQQVLSQRSGLTVTATRTVFMPTWLISSDLTQVKRLLIVCVTLRRHAHRILALQFITS